MKTEREIAEDIFQVFRKNNCQNNQGFLQNHLNAVLFFQLNPKEQELFNIVFVGLQALDMINVDSDGRFIRLTTKGYNTIYDDEKTAKLLNTPWLIPPYSNADWEKAYNKLWHQIGPQESAPYYISGPKFYKIVSEFDETLQPSYALYIQNRNNRDLPTSRVVYYKELLDNLSEEKRYEVYVKIQDTIESQSSGNSGDIIEDKQIRNPFLQDVVPAISVEKKTIEVSAIANDGTNPASENAPVVYISYSWDNEDHKKWVRDLATNLRDNGVDAKLDQWCIRPGVRQPHFFECISTSDKVLCILTPNYKNKTDNLAGGVGAEYSIITADMADHIDSEKYIPILKEGNKGDAVPVFLQGINYVDMTDASKYDERVEDVLRAIFNEPKIKEPPIGKKPSFCSGDEISNGHIESSSTISKTKDERKKKIVLFVQEPKTINEIANHLGINVVSSVRLINELLHKGEIMFIGDKIHKKYVVIKN